MDNSLKTLAKTLLSKNPQKIFIDGVSGVGKTPFSRDLRNEFFRLGSCFSVVHLDDYIIPNTEGEFKIAAKYLQDSLELEKNSQICFEGICAMNYISGFLKNSDAYVRLSKYTETEGVKDLDIYDSICLQDGKGVYKKQYEYYPDFDERKINTQLKYWVIIKEVYTEDFCLKSRAYSMYEFNQKSYTEYLEGKLPNT